MPNARSKNYPCYAIGVSKYHQRGSKMEVMIGDDAWLAVIIATRPSYTLIKVFRKLRS